MISFEEARQRRRAVVVVVLVVMAVVVDTNGIMALIAASAKYNDEGSHCHLHSQSIAF